MVEDLNKARGVNVYDAEYVGDQGEPSPDGEPEPAKSVPRTHSEQQAFIDGFIHAVDALSTMMEVNGCSIGASLDVLKITAETFKRMREPNE